MSNSDPNFSELIKKQKLIQEAIESEYLRHNTERVENPNLPTHKDTSVEEQAKVDLKSELPPSSDEEVVVMNPTKEVQNAIEK